MKILITGGNGNLANMIKKHLDKYYIIINPSHNKLDLLDFNKLNNYLNENEFDILINTAIIGGRRCKPDNYDTFYYNMLMFENIIHFSHKFKMIINFDSAAIYDRKTNINMRNEDELFTIPTDYYGFSKYTIYKRSLQYSHMFNLRIFNIFHINEEPERFIKSCFISKYQNKHLTIQNDKYFDFVYEDDFINIVKYYIDNLNQIHNLKKTINICYDTKYKLSEIAFKIINNKDLINVVNNDLHFNYSGSNELLKNMNINLLGLDKTLKIYENKYKEINIKLNCNII